MADVELLTPDEFAIEAGISRKTAYNYIKDGRVISQRHPMTGRLTIPASELEKVVGPGPSGTMRVEKSPEFPTPPIVTEPPSLKGFILKNIEEVYGKEARTKVSDNWGERVQATVDFMLDKLKLKPNYTKIAALIRGTPNVEQLSNFDPLTWLPALLSSGSPTIPEVVPTDPGTGVRRRPVTAPPDDEEERYEDEEEEEEEEPPPPPVRRRRLTREEDRAVSPDEDDESCEVCGQQEGGHASGCPRQRPPAGLDVKPGSVEARIPSPAASAKQAEAFSRRRGRELQGDFGLMGEFKECKNPAKCIYPHRSVRMHGRAGHVMGHFQTEVDNVDRARRLTLQQMGEPSLSPPPPEVLATKPRRGTKKKGKARSKR